MGTTIHWDRRYLGTVDYGIEALRSPEIDLSGFVFTTTILAPERTEAREKFDVLARRWAQSVQSFSSTTKRIEHPDYKAIIALGRDAIPLILEELRREPNHWFHALRMLTQTDPVPQEQRGNMRAMADTWVAWGRDHGYLK